MEVFLSALHSLTQGFANFTWQTGIMVAIGCVLLYLGIARKFEPLLLLPIGFGIILGNLPLATLSAHDKGGIINLIYNTGILTEIFPCLLFLGLGAMIDFGPMLANPRGFLLWHAIGANTGGQIGSVMAAAVILAIMSGMHIGPVLQ